MSCDTEKLLSNPAHRDFRKTSSPEVLELLNHIHSNKKGANFEETWPENSFHGSSPTSVVNFASSDLYNQNKSKV